MLNLGQAIVDLQVLLQERHAAFIRALQGCTCVCMSTPAGLSLSAEIHRTLDTIVCNALEACCRSLHAESGTDTSVYMCLAEWRPLSSKQEHT